MKHKLPFFYVSAADGTNVVRIFEEAIALAIKQKENPDKDDVLVLLRSVYHLEHGFWRTSRILSTQKNRNMQVLDDIMALLAEDDNADML